MKNIKDKENKITVREINSQDLSMNIQSKNSFKLLAEKGQKIVTAIYMITDILSKTDPMYVLIRDKSVDAMKCLFENLIKSGESKHLEEAQHNLYELLSYLSIIHRVGSLSKMNYDILFREIGLLQKSIKREILTISRNSSGIDAKTSLPDLFKLNNVVEDSIDVGKVEANLNKEKIEGFVKEDDKEEINSYKEEIKDTHEYLDNIIEDKEDSFAKQDFLRDSDGLFTEDELDLMSLNEEMSLNENNDLLQEDDYIIDDEILTEDDELSLDDDFDNNFKLDDTDMGDSEYKKDVKTERHEDIVNILRGKKNASITDICFFFEDCSSKTIQRDLKELIRDGRVIKEGDRRWAKYNLK